MKPLIAAACVLLAAVLPATALAQAAERLTRPFPESYVGSDGRLVVSRNATLGNMAVDQYSRLGATMFAGDRDPTDYADVYRETLCDRDGVVGLVVPPLSEMRRSMSRETRAALRARDAGALRNLSIDVLARLDGVDAEAIRADEATSPGVYHNAIRALAFGLDICDFYGRRP